MIDQQEPYELDYTSEPAITVKFIMCGDDLQPDVITELLNLTPSKSWTKGEDIPKEPGTGLTPKVTYPFGQWMLYAPCSRRDDFVTQLEALLRLLEQSTQQLQQLTYKYDAGISVAYSSGEDNMGIHLDKMTLIRMVKLGLSFDVIVYPLG